MGEFYPNPAASYFLGLTGSLSVLQRLDPQQYASYQTQLIELAAGNIDNPVLEPLWGGPGSVIPIVANLEQKPGAVLLQCLVDHVEYMRGAASRSKEFGCWFWIQDLYGEKRQLLGAGHGFVGNMYPFVRGLSFLPESLQDWVLETAVETTLNTMTREGDWVNWRKALDSSADQPASYLLQWCHGAPGVIMSLNGIPRGYSTEFDQALLMAGETIWAAGPLTKGNGFCHGTDGNGYALLKLFIRTGDELWLERARAFAMHALTQYRGALSVWVGDSGLPLYLKSCIEADDRLPLLDLV